MAPHDPCFARSRGAIKEILPMPARVAAWAAGFPILRKFFGSFFQKRTSS
jgi:hypothetical protein